MNGSQPIAVEVGKEQQFIKLIYSLILVANNNLENLIFSICPADLSVETLFWDIIRVTKRQASNFFSVHLHVKILNFSSTFLQKSAIVKPAVMPSIRVAPFWNHLPVNVREAATQFG